MLEMLNILTSQPLEKPAPELNILRSHSFLRSVNYHYHHHHYYYYYTISSPIYPLLEAARPIPYDDSEPANIDPHDGRKPPWPGRLD